MQQEYPKDIQGQIDSVVGEHGWAVVGGELGDDDPIFASSVGFTESFDHPEIIIIGFEPAVMGALINNVGKLVSRGARLADGCEADRIISGGRVAFREIRQEVHEPHTLLLRKRYGRGRYKVLQMFLPDDAGRFPWDEGCDPDMSEFQNGLIAADDR